MYNVKIFGVELWINFLIRREHVFNSHSVRYLRYVGADDICHMGRYVYNATENNGSGPSDIEEIEG